MFDGKAFGEELVGVVKGYVDRATAPLLERIGELENRQPEPIERMVGEAVAKIPLPRDGNDVDPAIIRQMVSEAVAALPVPSPGKDADPAIVQRMVEEAVSAIPPVERLPPIEPDMDAIAGMVAREVEKRFAGIPVPQDGKSITVDDVRPLINEAIGKAVGAIREPKDGVGLGGALIDRTGNLVVTLTDGTTRELGPVVGKDVDQQVIERSIADAVSAIPKPRDGSDGLGFDDLQFEHDGERGFALKFVRGVQVKRFEFRVPLTIYRGVWREGTHEKGDAVIWAGSLWVAQKDTDAKPDSGGGWQLAVKRGRDAKDAAKI